MTPFIVEAMVRRTLSEVSRVRLTVVACVAAAAALAAVGAISAVAMRSGSAGAVIWTLVGFGGATCFGVWGGRALRHVHRLERRIVEVVSSRP